MDKSSSQKKQYKDNDSCFFCGKHGYKKKNCKYHAWCAKEVTSLVLVCSKVNLDLVPNDI